MSFDAKTLLIADDFQKDGGAAAGFVKNDTLGNFLFGQSGGSGSGGAWSLIETKTVTGAAVASVTFLGLDGNTEEVYRLVLKTRNPTASNAVLTMRPNGIAVTGASATWSVSSTGGTAASNNPTELRLVQSQSTLNQLVGEYIFWVKADGIFSKQYRGTNSKHVPSSNRGLEMVSGAWNDTATNITSLEIRTDIAGAIGINSFFSLYKINK